MKNNIKIKPFLSLQYSLQHFALALSFPHPNCPTLSAAPAVYNLHDDDDNAASVFIIMIFFPAFVHSSFPRMRFRAFFLFLFIIIHTHKQLYTLLLLLSSCSSSARVYHLQNSKPVRTRRQLLLTPCKNIHWTLYDECCTRRIVRFCVQSFPKRTLESLAHYSLSHSLFDIPPRPPRHILLVFEGLFRRARQISSREIVYMRIHSSISSRRVWQKERCGDDKSPRSERTNEIIYRQRTQRSAQ